MEGYIYMSPTPERHGEIVQIVGRETPDPQCLLPTFRVVFEDGLEAVALSHHLHPWYPGAGWPLDD